MGHRSVKHDRSSSRSPQKHAETKQQCLCNKSSEKKCLRNKNLSTSQSPRFLLLGFLFRENEIFALDCLLERMLHRQNTGTSASECTKIAHYHSLAIFHRRLWYRRELLQWESVCRFQPQRKSQFPSNS